MAMSGSPIDRCVCQNTPFRSLLPVVKAHRDQGITDDGSLLILLREQTGCMADCSLCQPYIKRMIENGRTEFSPSEPVADQ